MSDILSKKHIEQALQLNAHTQDITKKHRQIAEEFEASLEAADHQQMLSETHLGLSDYLSAVKLVLDDSFDHEVWVRAEIRAMNSKNGHYYFELAETDDDDTLIASCRATLWRYKAQAILAKFARTTQQPLQAGISVLIRCRASFHEQYGFSLTISDIDPNYTLGELAAAYSAMKNRLSDEGLLDKNQQLSTPFDIHHVIVIAPEKAAGLGDFQAEAHRLQQAGACNFHYHHATFQGNHAAAEIRTTLLTALQAFLDAQRTPPDLLVIIRGGGAVGDLAYLNDYELAAVVAECPVPVWVGIGHQRDMVILDEVAHTSFDTPSKVIFGIQNHLIQQVEKSKLAMQTIQKQAQNLIQSSKQKNALAIRSIYTHSAHTLNMANKDSEHQMKQVRLLSLQQLKSQQLHLSAHNARLKNLSHQHLHHQKQQLKQLLTQQKSTLSYLSQLKKECRHLQSLILIQHPQRTLAKGYALLYDNQQKSINSIKKLQENQEVHLKLQDGSATAIIKSTQA